MTRSWLRIASRYRFWLAVFGVISFLRDGTEIASRKMLLRSAPALVGQDAQRRADVRRLDRQPRSASGPAAPRTTRSAAPPGARPPQRDLVPAGDDPEVVLGLQQTQVLVVAAEEGPRSTSGPG